MSKKTTSPISSKRRGRRCISRYSCRIKRGFIPRERSSLAPTPISWSISWCIIPRFSIPRFIIPRCIIPRFIIPRCIIPRFIIPRFIIPRFIPCRIPKPILFFTLLLSFPTPFRGTTHVPSCTAVDTRFPDAGSPLPPSLPPPGSLSTHHAPSLPPHETASPAARTPRATAVQTVSAAADTAHRRACRSSLGSARTSRTAPRP